MRCRNRSSSRWRRRRPWIGRCRAGDPCASRLPLIPSRLGLQRCRHMRQSIGCQHESRPSRFGSRKTAQSATPCRNHSAWRFARAWKRRWQSSPPRRLSLGTIRWTLCTKRTAFNATPKCSATRAPCYGLASTRKWIGCTRRSSLKRPVRLDRDAEGVGEGRTSRSRRTGLGNITAPAARLRPPQPLIRLLRSHLLAVGEGSRRRRRG